MPATTIEYKGGNWVNGTSRYSVKPFPLIKFSAVDKYLAPSVASPAP
ncbi:MAG: hypothetical protein MZV64_62500 [Ignavibacteriales bacterium]|nr:hypothetical protein [Ignavibacteriales bacterium]